MTEIPTPTQGAATFDVPADVLSGAYSGLLVLRTMCRKAGLAAGAEKAEEIAGQLAEIDPSLPARSALRALRNPIESV